MRWFQRCPGSFIVTLDGDLQHDPADIPRFTDRLEEGFDIVCGWRTHRTEGSALQRASNRFANWALSKLTGIRIHDWGGGFKAYKRQLISDVPIYGELQRFIPALALQRNTRVCEVEITVSPRMHGVSNYGVVRKLPVFFDLITVRFLLRYLSRPLHFFGTAGLIAAVAGAGLGFWLLVERLAYGAHVMAEHGPLLIFATVLIVCGVQLLALGLLGEIQVRHHYENRSRNGFDNGFTVIRAEAQPQSRSSTQP